MTSEYLQALDAQVANKPDTIIVSAYQHCMTGHTFRELADRSAQISRTVETCRCHRLEDQAIRQEFQRRIENPRYAFA